MSKAIPLDEQIVATLTGLCTSEQAAAVLADAEAVLRDLTSQADAADVASLSPLATSAEAKRLRNAANDHRFDADRMEASVSALSARVADLQDAERAVREEAERVATLKRRDDLAAEIAATYPRIVADLTALAKRIEDAGSIGASAEALGRGIAENFYHAGGPVMRIGEIQLPMPGSSELAFDYRPVTFQPGGNITPSGRVWRGLELAQDQVDAHL